MTPDSTQTPDVASQVLFERTHLVIPSLPHWIEPTVEYLRHKSVLCGACQETRARKLLVALLEALSNAVIHGNLQISSELKEAPDDAFARALAERAADPVLSARVVDILMDYDGDACRWIITDEGQGFDVERVMARCLSDDPEIMLSSGRGILMMHSFLDDLYYDLGGRRVILTLDRRNLELTANLHASGRQRAAVAHFGRHVNRLAVAGDADQHALSLSEAFLDQRHAVPGEVA